MIRKKSWRRTVWPLLGAGALLYLFLGGEYNVYHYWRAIQEEKGLKMRLVEMEQEHKRLVEESRRLRDDPVYIEKVARERFNMGRPGEKIYLTAGNENK